MSAGLPAEKHRPDDRLAEIIPYPGRRNAFTAYLGMVIFLASWAMMFASLFFSYGLVRSRAPVWPPLDQPRLPLALPGLNVAVAAASSAILVGALGAFRARRPKRAARLITAATGLGALFLVLQLVVWVSLWRAGLQPDGGPYASVFYALTAFHALHVAVGLVALVVLAGRTRLGRYGPAHHLPVRLWSLYWHFVGVVWLAIYASVYVL
jgi:cytochrome c oxidase subunit 3